MIDVEGAADRSDPNVIVDLAIRRLDRNVPFSCFRAQQDDSARLLVMHDQRVGIRDHLHRWNLAGADVVDYVALARVQGDRHFRAAAIGGKQQAGLKHEHADRCSQPRKQSISSLSFHLLHLGFFAACLWYVDCFGRRHVIRRRVDGRPGRRNAAVHGRRHEVVMIGFRRARHRR